MQTHTHTHGAHAVHVITCYFITSYLHVSGRTECDKR